ncbi:MAG: mechanosensitive ion channel family protein, partial [Verrucomicrobiae bacterium]|nr:mechanosensitive ion channel family protein [Verrucomicrobiae bacterium]
EAEVLAKGFANSSISLLVRYWIEVPGDTNYFFARSEGVQAIHRSFKEEGIVIPFPIRTLEFGNGCNELVSNLVTESGASN